MSPQLLDLPDELLDATLAELLPPRAKSKQPRYSIDDSAAYPNYPKDLVRMTAVCQSLRRLALPWVCRRAKIYLERSHSYSNPPSYWLLLENNPDLAKYTQSFTLDINDELSISDDLYANLAELPPAIRLMDNLRVVSFLCEAFALRDSMYAIVTEIFAEVTSKPHLHTLLSNYYAPIGLSHLPALKHLCCLRLQNIRIEELLPLGPCIESLAIIDDNESLITVPRDIPWGTLREIRVVIESGHDGWVGLFDSFSDWKTKNPNIPSPLEEVAMDITEGISHEQIEDLLITFQGQNLHTLILYTVDFIDGGICDTIVHTFPGLKNLHLFGEIWSSQLPEVAASLSALKFLKLFHFNYKDNEFTSPPEQVAWTERYHDLLPVLGTRCQALEYVGFYSHELFWSFFAIKRDDRGQYDVHVEEPREHDTPLFTSTSTWDTRRYRYI